MDSVEVLAVQIGPLRASLAGRQAVALTVRRLELVLHWHLLVVSVTWIESSSFDPLELLKTHWQKFKHLKLESVH